jgi:hypothetical protein
VPRTSRGRELRAVLGHGLVLLGKMCRRVREEEGEPCMCDDDVVEWCMALAEAGEADLDYHCYNECEM